jgi:DNA-binding NarL/FixJ family response regulator
VNNPLRIIIQESDADFRKQFEKDVKDNEGFELVKSYKSFYAFADEAHSFNVDVIVLNWHYPTQKLFDFIASSKENNPQTKILVTFDFVQPDFIFKTIACGADEILLKPFSVAEILHGSKQLHENKKLQFHLDRLQ